MIDWLARFHCDFPHRLYQSRLNLYTGHGFDLYDLFEVQQSMIAMYCDGGWICGVAQLWLMSFSKIQNPIYCLLNLFNLNHNYTVLPHYSFGFQLIKYKFYLYI